MQKIHKVEIKKRLISLCIVLLILFLSCIPCYAATSGNDGNNTPEIPLNLELHYPDKSVYSSITDKIFLSNRTASFTVSTSGRTLNFESRSVSTGSNPIVLYRSIASQYSLDPIGFTITAPTFYLSRSSTSSAAFDQTDVFIRIPEYISARLIITYDVYFGGTEPAGHVTKTVNSGFDNFSSIVPYSVSDINFATNSDGSWLTCRIDNLKITTDTFAYRDSPGGDPSILSGTWVIGDNFDFVSGDESYVTLYFPFRSNGHHFNGITFGDTIELLYNAVPESDTLVVWDYEVGWVNTAYKTITVDDDVTWNDVAVDEANSFSITDPGHLLFLWLYSNAEKLGTDNNYYGQPFVYYRYASVTPSTITSVLNQYFDEYGEDPAAVDQAYQNGLSEGHEIGYNIGYSRGYEEGLSGFNPDVTTWLANTVKGFLSFEIVPGISFYGIIGIFVFLGLALAFLKFFAGG